MVIKLPHLFHKMTPWEQYDAQMKSWTRGRPESAVTYTERRQKRHCEICNKEEDEKVRRDGT